MAVIPIKTKKLIFLGMNYPGAERLKGSILVKNVSHILQDAVKKCLFLLTLLHIIEVSKCLAHNL